MQKQYELLTDSELLNYYSDYHKDLRGYRPTPENLTRNETLKRIGQLDSFINSMSETVEGRNSSRDNNFLIREPTAIEDGWTPTKF